MAVAGKPRPLTGMRGSGADGGATAATGKRRPLPVADSDASPPGRMLPASVAASCRARASEIACRIQWTGGPGPTPAGRGPQPAKGTSSESPTDMPKSSNISKPKIERLHVLH